MKKKLIDAEAWLKGLNDSWMYANLAKKIIREAPFYEVEEELLTPFEGSERADVPMDDANKVTRTTSSPASGPPSPTGEGNKKPNVCKCRACGAQIVWVTMQSGKKMPCDAELIHAVADEKAKTSFVLPGGIIKHGTIGRHPDGTADFVGYRSHFETCPKSEEFRRERK